MRAEKQLLLDEIKEKIEVSQGFVALSYQNFTSAKARAFRDLMDQAGGEFEVVRKRVFGKAAQVMGMEFNVKELQGHVGILFAREDASQVLKQAVKYGEDNDNAVTILGGYIDGVICSAEDAQAIAKLPGIKEMRAQFVGLLEAPMAQTAQVFHAILASVMHCAEERSKKGLD